MAKYKIPYLCESPRKNSNYFYWNPPAPVRQFGWSVVPLKTARKNSPLYIAMQQAQWLNSILKAWRDGDVYKSQEILDCWSSGKNYKDLSTVPCISINLPDLNLKNDPNQQTLNNLIERYLKSPNFKGLRPKTQREYGYQLNSIKSVMGRAKKSNKDTLITDITRKVVKTYYDMLCDTISPNTAKARLTTLKMLFTYAIELDWTNENPVKAIRIKSSKPRVVIWEDVEIQEFIKQADKMNLKSIADATIVACHSATCLGDILEMSELQYKEGCILIAQNKTGTIVNIPLTVISEKRIKQAIERNMLYRKSKSIINNALPLFVCETTLERSGGYRIWKQKNFNTWFNKVKAKVAEKHPSIKGKNFQDLRDTAVTLMARAGADKFEIASITGHSFASVDTVLKHYLSLNQNMSDSAIKKMTNLIGNSIIK